MVEFRVGDWVEFKDWVECRATNGVEFRVRYWIEFRVRDWVEFRDRFWIEFRVRDWVEFRDRLCFKFFKSKMFQHANSFSSLLKAK